MYIRTDTVALKSDCVDDLERQCLYLAHDAYIVTDKWLLTVHDVLLGQGKIPFPLTTLILYDVVFQ